MKVMFQDADVHLWHWCRHWQLQSDRLPCSEADLRLSGFEQNFRCTETRRVSYSVLTLFLSADKSHDKVRIAANAPINCAAMNPGASAGRMPEKVLVIDRAMVTAGFAKDVEAVNQYAPVMYAATANGSASRRVRLQP